MDVDIMAKLATWTPFASLGSLGVAPVEAVAVIHFHGLTIAGTAIPVVLRSSSSEMEVSFSMAGNNVDDPASQQLAGRVRVQLLQFLGVSGKQCLSGSRSEAVALV